MTYIEIAHLQKKYRKKEVLRDVTMSMREGECVGILGSNGCGKSTLLSVLAGVQRADGGTFTRDGADLLHNEKLRRSSVGYVPQGNPLYEELTAWDNLSMWYDRKTLERELEDGALSRLGIRKFLRVPVRKLSGGMKKRLSIGCAVSAHPGLLLLDEPSAALDLEGQEYMECYIADFCAAGGMVLLVTHNPREMERCNRWYLLQGGVLTDYAYDGDIHRLVESMHKEET